MNQEAIIRKARVEVRDYGSRCVLRCFTVFYRAGTPYWQGYDIIRDMCGEDWGRANIDIQADVLLPRPVDHVTISFEVAS